jgi:hypothetical protein
VNLPTASRIERSCRRHGGDQVAASRAYGAVHARRRRCSDRRVLRLGSGRGGNCRLLGPLLPDCASGSAVDCDVASFDGTTVAEPPLRYKRPDTYVNVDPPNPWGELRGWNKAEDGSPIPVQICIKRVRILLSVSPAELADPNLGPQLDDALSPWWDALSSWVEVVTGQDLANLGDRRPKKPQTFHLWAGNADGTMRPLAMLFHATPFPQAPALTSDGLQGCLSAVASGQAAPQERLHLSDARSLHNDGQWRRAVIDAATAAEVGITSWIDSNAEPDVKASVVKNPLTLGRPHRRYSDLGGTVPDDFQEVVVNPRNDAAHRGMSLTREQSAAAIETTAALLDATTPIVL